MKKIKLELIKNVDELLDTAFRKARKEASSIDRHSNHLQRRKDIEANKVKIIEEFLREKIFNSVASYPDLENLPPFYREMLTAVAGIGDVKKALGHVKSITKMMKKFRIECLSSIYKSSREEDIRKHRQKFYGKIGSLFKRAKKSFALVNAIGYELKHMPLIDFDTKTVVLAGFPNSGKTTILARLTKSKPKIAEYPFTTKNLNIGFLEGKFLNIQVIDSPGILDREENKRNPIEKRALSALRHLGDLLIFIVDPRESSYPIAKQLKLLKEIEKEFIFAGKSKMPIIVVVNKADSALKEEIEAVKTEHEKIITGEGIESNLRERICELLGVKMKDLKPVDFGIGTTNVTEEIDKFAYG